MIWIVKQYRTTPQCEVFTYHKCECLWEPKWKKRDGATAESLICKKILETQMRILSKISFQGSLWLSAGMGLGTELRWENIHMGSTSFPRLATRQAPMAESMFISLTWDRTGFSQLLLFALESTVNLARWDCPSKNIWEVFKFSSVLTSSLFPWGILILSQVPPLARTFVLGEVVPPGGDWSRPALQFVKDAVEGFTCRWC